MSCSYPSSWNTWERFPQDPDWLKITWLPAAHNPPPPRFTISYILCSQGRLKALSFPSLLSRARGLLDKIQADPGGTPPTCS